MTRRRSATAWPAMPRPVCATAAVAGMIVLAGCSSVPPADLSQAVEVPVAWRSPAVTEQALDDRPWGALFRSPELDRLIEQALQANSDLRLAVERVELARAQYAAARSLTWPTLGVQLDASRGRQPAGPGPENVIVESAALGLFVANWEIDLWGRLRSASEAQRRLLLASEETQRAVTASLIGAVSRSYLRLLDLDNRRQVTQRQIEARGESLRVVRLRHEAGIVAGSDLRTAESNLAQAHAALAEIERQRSQAENALAVLVGRNPGPVAREAVGAAYAGDSLLPAGLPSRLLARRPDVLAAEEAVRASEANIDAARKAYFPTISLTAVLGFASPALSGLFDDGRDAWSVAPSVTAPIFTAGRLAAGVDQAQAQQRIAVEQYRQTVRTAFREVEDALVAYRRSLEQREALDRTVAADRERARLADLRYKAGVTIYLEVLLAQQDVFESELRLSQAARDVHEAVVDLYVALGGGWTPRDEVVGAAER